MTEDWKKWEGQVVNKEFPLRQYLGGSDHSAVFLTERGEPEPQKAAIKLILADPENTELQLARWRQAAKLSHPHLLRLFQMGRCQLGSVGLLYVVMEYAEEDLSQILPQRPLTPEEARDMLQHVLDALAYVHNKGFVHGHLKPANIMAVNEQVRVSSDGLRGINESNGGRSKPGVYDPPEAVSGRISPAGDVWSLGMMLVEAVTQRLPAREGTDQAEPALPKTLPAPYLDITRHCLRLVPRLRWTVADIAARMQAASLLPQEQMTTRPREAFAKWRYVVPTAVVSLILVAMLAGSRQHPRPEAPRVPAIAAELPRIQPKPEPKPAKPQAGQPTKNSGDEKQSSGGTAPAPASLRSGAAAPTLTGDRVPGEVLRQVVPDVPQSARNTITGTVKVRVRVAVDASGSVVGALFDSPGPSKYFANLALQSARRWEFAPAKVDGRDVPSEWLLRFGFARTGTKVVPVQVSP